MAQTTSRLLISSRLRNIQYMTSKEIRAKFLEYFVSKGHTLVPSSSLVPDDPSVLLTTAGMQQFKPYYAELDPTSAVHPSIGKPIGRAACSVQKCFRTSDIDEVGDERHLTFFEMLGNFSFGGYFKKEAIGYAHEFITKVMGLPISYVTIFEGSDAVPKDEESRAIWNSLGITDVREEGMDEVFWGPTGNGGPCGPCTEIYVKTADGKDVEVWNNVFNEFISSGSREDLLAGRASLKRLERPGVDTGMGFERLVIMSQNVKTIFDTDAFQAVFGDILAAGDPKSARITADHLRSAVFLLADGIIPTNKDRGYVLRRILRRLVVHSQKLGLRDADLISKIDAVVGEYGQVYPEVQANIASVKDEFLKEYVKFNKALAEGLRKFDKLHASADGKADFLEGMAKGIFDLYQSCGLPFDVSYDLLAEKSPEFVQDGLRARVTELFADHQEISKAGAAGKFGGHGLVMAGEMKAANDEEVKRVTRMHTATHLLHQALRKVLGNDVHQQGSDITPERLRFDFTYPQKLTPEQLSDVEQIVNDAILKDETVTMEEKPFKQAIEEGALAFFKNKYPETVKVYSVGSFSKEVCGGPHVSRTSEVGSVKIIKEEAVSAGVRRIRAVVKP
jgi:alanyl-tRNA synthetase